MNRRKSLALILGPFAAGGAVLAATNGFGVFDQSATAQEVFEISFTEAEWRDRLTDGQFGILRQEHTERPYTSALNAEKRAGIFRCAGCELPVYSSQTKYDSGTGWPSFYDALPNAIGTKVDNSLFMSRTEVHCRRCGGHFGHIFNDGPAPTGKRHCLNGLALRFEPSTA